MMRNYGKLSHILLRSIGFVGISSDLDVYQLWHFFFITEVKYLSARASLSVHEISLGKNAKSIQTSLNHISSYMYLPCAEMNVKIKYLRDFLLFDSSDFDQCFAIPEINKTF